jgi:adenosylhomocysteine nucleosidase
MKIGIIGAMPEEINLLLDRMENRTSTHAARLDFSEGTIGGTPVVLVACNMGKVAAAVCAEILLERFGVTHLVFTGVAGSLDPSVDIGDLVISTDCVQHDMDATGLGHEIGQNPDFGITYFPADERLRAAAVSAAAVACPEVGVHEGRVATGDQFVNEPKLKDHIVETFGAMCCEMEGAAVGQVAWLNEVPFVVVRAISDKADDEGGVDFRTFLEDSARRCAALVERMVLDLGEE